MLADVIPGPRNEAITALGSIGPASAPAVPKLTELLKGRSVTVRKRVLRALASIGPEAREAADAIAAQVDGGNTGLRQEAVIALGRIGQGAPVLGKVLTSGTADERRLAAVTLAELGTAAAGSLDELHRAMKNSDAELRLHAAFAYWKAGGEKGEALSLLRNGLKQDNWPALNLAMRLLGRMGPDASDAAGDLGKFLKDDDPHVRHSAVQALVQIGSAAVPMLREALETDHLGTRRYLTLTLARLGAEAKSAVPALARGLWHKEALIREASAQALGAIGPVAKKARSALLKVSKEDEDEVVRQAATEALEKIEGK
jgi:HEAT repeat protein